MSQPIYANVRNRPLDTPKIILLPINLKARLHAIREPLTVLLDIPRLTSILSKDDVSFYLWCQHNFRIFFYQDIMDTLYAYDFPMELADNELFSKFNQFDIESHLPKDKVDNTIKENINPFNNEMNIRPFYDGLFSAKSGGLYIREYTFETTEITNDYFAITLKPFNKLESSSKQLLHSYEELLSHLRRYVPLTELGFTSLFEKFCQISMA